MTKVQKAIFWTFGIISSIFMLIILLMPCCFPIARQVTCEKLYYSEVSKNRGALAEYIIADKPLPTLDKMVSDGLYTLPQDRAPITDGYPIDPHDLSVKLLHIDHPYKWFAYKVIITSTKGRCAKGNIFVYSSSDYEGHWLDRQFGH